MGKKKRNRIWWWIIPVIVILGGLGYYLYARTGQKAEKVQVARKISPAGEKVPSKKGPETRDLGRERPEEKAVSDRYEGGKTVAMLKKEGPEKEAHEKGASKKPLGTGAVPLSREDLLKELRSATANQMERLSELGKEDFVKIDNRIKHLMESGKDDAIRIAAQAGRVSESAKEGSTGTEGEIKRLFEPGRQDLFGKASADKIYCTLIEEYIADFFLYLDSERYIQKLDLKTNTYSQFRKILKQLTARPPVPAGEGMQPTTMVANIYYFSRALDRRDLLLFKEVATNERDTMEVNLEMFYRWFMLGNLCPNPDQARPSFDVMYRYAGFFLNTTGGRAYLFRRPLRLRLLVSYYCLLIIYQADRLGKNSYGLNIAPYIQPLKDELKHHPELEFQGYYIRSLNRIEDYYLQKR